MFNESNSRGKKGVRYYEFDGSNISYKRRLESAKIDLTEIFFNSKNKVTSEEKVRLPGLLLSER